MQNLVNFVKLFNITGHWFVFPVGGEGGGGGGSLNINRYNYGDVQLDRVAKSTFRFPFFFTFDRVSIWVVFP